METRARKPLELRPPLAGDRRSKRDAAVTITNRKLGLSQWPVKGSRRISRRRLLAGAVAAPFLRAADRKTNVVFFMTDDHGA
jgi:hypothetical protein